MPNGEILILTCDGCLCHPEVDLVSWLRQDLPKNQIILDDWQEEKRRSYEGFPNGSSCGMDETNRMLITFTDDTTYEVWIKDSEK